MQSHYVRDAVSSVSNFVYGYRPVLPYVLSKSTMKIYTRKMRTTLEWYGLCPGADPLICSSGLGAPPPLPYYLKIVAQMVSM